MSFAGWSGACSGTSTTCQVTMNSDTNVSAAFITKSLSSRLLVEQGEQFLHRGAKVLIMGQPKLI
jgi:hypothetical protein